ncbi:MAG: hypothetical protein JOZ92_07055 [Candidatus Dormibacteraeota bacterium]|nr:hypothetical protein [Candidatus Dormibacteraeota bacterium]
MHKAVVVLASFAVASFGVTVAFGGLGAQAASGDVTCTGPAPAYVAHDLIVPPGECDAQQSTIGHDAIVENGGYLVLFGSHVTHDVVVQQGGELFTGAYDGLSSVGGDITASQPKGIDITDITVDDSINVAGVTGDGPSLTYLDGKRSNNAVCGAQVGHSVSIVNSASTAAEWMVGSNNESESQCSHSDSVQRDLDLLNNHNVAIDVGNDEIGDDLNILNNAPASTDVFHNTVGHKANCRGNGASDGSTGGNTVSRSNNGCG